MLVRVTAEQDQKDQAGRTQYTSSCLVSVLDQGTAILRQTQTKQEEDGEVN